MSKTESKAQVSDCDVVKKSIRILILVTKKKRFLSTKSVETSFFVAIGCD